MASLRTLTTYAVAFYIGATAAFLVPFTSPVYVPIAALAHFLAGSR